MSAGKAAGVTTFYYTFFETPAWASSNPTQPCSATKGQGISGCAAPPTNISDWDNFVTALVTRYKGEIAYYELWNEPNISTEWSGTVAQMVQLAQAAYPIIKSIDPSAIVIAPSPAFGGVVSTDPNCTPTSNCWLASYLAAGGAQYADAVGFHGKACTNDVSFCSTYSIGCPSNALQECAGAALVNQVNDVKSIMAANGLAGKPLIDTEGGWASDTALNDVPNASSDQQAAYFSRFFITQASEGLQASVLFDWCGCSIWTGLGPSSAEPEIIADYTQTYDWLVGSTMDGVCSEDSNSVWICPITMSNGNAGEIVWSDSATSFAAPSIYTSYQDLNGTTSPITGAVTIGILPEMLKSTTGSSTTTTPTTTTQPPSGPGYWMLDSSGTVHPFGSAVNYGSATGIGTAAAIAPTPDGGGYWVASASGQVEALGDAQNVRLLPATQPVGTVVTIAATKDGKGYWLATNAGLVVTAGDAQGFGDLSTTHLNAPIVNMAVTPDGGGYWLLGGDGGVFTFGDAGFFGSTGSIHLNQPAVAMAPTADGLGYWFVAADGGVFTNGDAGFFGSMGGVALAKPVNGMVVTPTGKGYWMVASDGGVFTFGDAGFVGSCPAAGSGCQSLPAPIVAFAPVPVLSGTDGGGGTTTTTTTTATVPGGVTPQCTGPGSAPDSFVPDSSAPHGIFVLTGTSSPYAQEVDQYLLNNPDVCGATVFVSWPLVETSSGTYDWSVIDTAISQWAQAGKIVNLLLEDSGFQDQVMQGVPTWLQSGLQTVTCGSSTQPVYWQSAFVSAWQAYVSAVVAHYSTNPNVGYIRVGIASGAQTLIVGTQTPGTCLDSWNAAGYQSEWPALVQQMITFAGSLKSPKELIISFNDYANYPVASEIYQWDAAAGVGTGFSGLQSSDVTDFNSGQPCGRQHTNWCALSGQYASQIPTFVQTLGSSYPGSAVTNYAPSLGDAEMTGPLPPLLTTALGAKVQIIEVYTFDLLLAFDPTWPGYAQYSSQYVQAFASTAEVVGTAGGAPPSS